MGQLEIARTGRPYDAWTRPRARDLNFTLACEQGLYVRYTQWPLTDPMEMVLELICF
jgi:hypothetical protein